MSKQDKAILKATKEATKTVSNSAEKLLATKEELEAKGEDTNYASIVASLKMDAEEHIEKGTIKLPVDVEAFADRLIAAQESLVGQLATLFGAPKGDRETYIRAIKQVCTEMSLAMKE